MLLLIIASASPNESRTTDSGSVAILSRHVRTNDSHTVDANGLVLTVARDGSCLLVCNATMAAIVE
jgi:hypothetical protein